MLAMARSGEQCQQNYHRLVVGAETAGFTLSPAKISSVSSAQRTLGGVRGARNTIRPMKQHDMPDDNEDEGVYTGTVIASIGRLFEVKLTDGRVVKGKIAGKAKHARQKITADDLVKVQFAMDMDEDMQTPSIIGKLEPPKRANETPAASPNKTR
eukprot:614582-Pleurochrysis_carterae.AAC.3